MKKRIASLLLALGLCLSLAACGAQPAQNDPKHDAQTDQNTPANTDPAPAAPEETEPQLSGKVTVYMPSPAGLADKLASAFTDKTGVEVEQFQGTTGEILARLEAEQANPVADVVILASWSDGLSMKADGQLESYTPRMPTRSTRAGSTRTPCSSAPALPPWALSTTPPWSPS